MLKLGKQCVCLSLCFLLFSSLSNYSPFFFSKELLTPQLFMLKLETFSPRSTLDSLQPWNVAWKILSVKLHKVNAGLFSYVATRGPRNNALRARYTLIRHSGWKLSSQLNINYIEWWWKKQRVTWKRQKKYFLEVSALSLWYTGQEWLNKFPLFVSIFLLFDHLFFFLSPSLATHHLLQHTVSPFKEWEREWKGMERRGGGGWRTDSGLLTDKQTPLCAKRDRQTHTLTHT